MSSGELLLTACVAAIVIPPAKWPLLAHHVAKLIHLWQQTLQQIQQFWQQQLALYQLADNEAKAQEHDSKNFME